MRARFAIVVLTLAVAATTTALVPEMRRSGDGWSKDELATLRSLSLSSLGSLPRDPSNRFADDSLAARLGRALFFDTRLSSNGQVSCASCHVPEKSFQDSRPLGKGVGIAGRRTMPVAGTAYSPWQFWDGRADSQWGQALGPLESSVEHGGDRLQYVRLMAAAYQRDYAAIFGALPSLAGLPEHAGPVDDAIRSSAWERIPSARQQDISRVYANIGKAIAAYERTISFTPSRFDRYVDAELAGRSDQDRLSSDERKGLRLFIGKANCVNCHNGALLTDNHFHNTGVVQATAGAANDSGRASGVKRLMASEFNCLGKFSDAKPADCDELRFMATEGPELLRAFKTPSLRNVAERGPYMHAGQLATLNDVIAHYDRAGAAPLGKSELKPLHLSTSEIRQLEAFLRTLTSPLSGNVTDPR